MKMNQRIPPTRIIVAIPLLILCIGLWYGPAKAFLPPGKPTYFAGNPSTRQLAFRYRLGLKAVGWSSDNTGWDLEQA
jgi:hypothetical protein